MSGAPVFIPQTGQVVGVIETKSSIGSSGYAVSAPLVVAGFLNAHHLAAGAPPTLPKAPVQAAAAPVFAAPVFAAQPPPPRPAPATAPVITVAAGPAHSRSAEGHTPSRHDSFERVQAPPERVVAACTRLLDAGTVDGGDLGRLYLHRSHAYSSLKKYDLAVGDLNELLRGDPNDEVAYNNRGFAYVAQGNYEAGLADFSAALRIDPNYAVAYYNRGSTYGYRGRYDLALDDLTQSVRIDPNNAAAYNRRGYAYIRLHRYDLAVSDLTMALSLNPSYALAYAYRGDAYAGENELDTAIDDYGRALRLDPNLASAYSARGRAYEQEGRTGRSSSRLRPRRAHRSQPAQPHPADVASVWFVTHGPCRTRGS